MSSTLHSHEYQLFRAMLTQARQASGLTQVQIAKQLGKPQSYVSKYENGERRLDVPEFIKLADILGLDVTAFIEELRTALAPAKTPRGRRKG